MYKYLVRPLFFFLSAENAHYLALNLLKVFCKFGLFRKFLKNSYQVEKAAIEKDLFGLKFPNPIGLAAGFDKNANYFNELFALGFGFIEIGTVTPLPQDGNPKPRLFRLASDKGLINRMGFNNVGLEAVKQNLKGKSNDLIIGGNIGKNKITPNEHAIDDYIQGIEQLHDCVDYFVVNISSPNTPGLRDLQQKDVLRNLLVVLNQKNQAFVKPKPLLIKISPDLNQNELHDVLDVVMELKIDGIVVSNTTTSRNNLRISSKKLALIGDGGLSGKPLRKMSTSMIKLVFDYTEGKVPIIGVGGIFNSQDVREKLEAGASLVQLYTGFIYEGPGIVKRILKSL